MPNSLKLTIELVPSPCWQINLRTSMARGAWDALRKSVYATYNYRCGICETSNVPLNCHEIWHYDDEKHIQKLVGFIALCPKRNHFEWTTDLGSYAQLITPRSE